MIAACPRPPRHRAAGPALALLLALLAGTASAQPWTDACVSGSLLGAAYDLANGLVAQMWSTDPMAPTGARGVRFALCPAGEGIEATVQLWNEQGSLPVPAPDAVGIAWAASESAETVSFEELVGRLNATGLQTFRTPSNAACACAAFYPGTPGAVP